MDRPIVYPGQIPMDSHLLLTNKHALIALAKFAQAMLGTTPSVRGLNVSPSTPNGLSVTVSAGEIYMLTSVDSSAYGTLLADPRTIVKQGILFDPVTVNLPNITTAAGQSVNYLIQATLLDVDQDPVVSPYYNSANPAIALSGPGNSGASQNSKRACTVQVTAKAGVPAATGTQTTPVADANNVGLWIVTLAYGQTSIDSGSVGVSAAPRIIYPCTTLNEVQPLIDFAGVPPGTVIGIDSLIVPTGWIKANGSVVPVSGPYARLATTVYCGDSRNATAPSNYRCTNPADPNGSRSTGGAYIKLRDFRSRFTRFLDDGRGVDTGRDLLTFQAGQMPYHTHSVMDATSHRNIALNDISMYTGDGTTHESGGAGGTSNGSENRPDNEALLAIIKL